MSASAPRLNGALPHSAAFYWPCIFTASLSPGKAVNCEQSDLLDMGFVFFWQGMLLDSRPLSRFETLNKREISGDVISIPPPPPLVYLVQTESDIRLVAFLTLYYLSSMILRSWLFSTGIERSN
ncbi:hypothetical protein BDV40DRAFT_263720 [Aspergillus tamarii]|uniref:Uncharacterized protein n=1 Tax=Aspergillus tamarii TaxID=41984 RepID=A0A5N6UWN4_ASPTM|nr:hypothetical protein BDV40DRAFT_263720 [Aspergillus tamarii]